MSFEELCTQERSVVALCAGEQCGVYRCQEVMEGSAAGRVVLARGGWRNKPPLLPSQQQMLDEAAKERRKPHEQHHIFPRAFRLWFERHSVDIDEYVIPLEVEKHRSIHRGANGGPWNAAWQKFIDVNRERKVATEEIHWHAGQLIYEFQLFGPVLPYSKQPPPLPRGY